MKKNELIKNESTVLVINGVPYSMVRFKEPENFIVCSSCDLRELCYDRNGNTTLYDLCEIGDGNNAWFFQQDWEILEKRIRDYIDVCDLAAKDLL